MRFRSGRRETRAMSPPPSLQGTRRCQRDAFISMTS
nr:MAG TPA: hypothetical protein [Caudoviricetes sp.]